MIQKKLKIPDFSLIEIHDLRDSSLDIYTVKIKIKMNAYSINFND
jgi:hypothetical protein